MKRITKKFLVKIGRGYQITIPKEIREALNLKVGDYLEATLDKKKRYMILTPLKKKTGSQAKEIAPGVIKDKEIHSSKPVIKGTRISPNLVLSHLMGGMTKEQVMQEYDLTQEHIEAAVAFGLRKGKLSQSKAAELLGIDRWQLVDVMAAYDVPTTILTKADLDQEEAHWARLRSKK